MTNKQVAQAFADGKQFGKSGSMFIEGNAIFSYGRHFPLAVRKDGKVYKNADRYSVTTSKQQGLVYGTLRIAGKELIPKTTQELKAMI